MNQPHRTDTAMFADAFPCNPVPFLSALGDYLAEYEARITDEKAKRLLFVVTAHLWGQMKRFDLAGVANLYRNSLRRLPGFESPEGAITAMLEMVPAMNATDRDANWTNQVLALVLFAYGETGELDLTSEWGRLFDAYMDETRCMALAA